MSFAHPWAVWLGLVAAAAPVVIHWLTRPRPVRLPLSTIRFVREAIRQRRARSRLRDLVVLALRTAAVLLLALAVARPQWGADALVGDFGSGESVRIVLLDVSQSMAASAGSVEALARARPVAAEYLRYRPGLRANLIVAGASARAVFDGPSTNFDALRDELAGCATRPERIDVNRALALAAGMLAPESAEDRRRRELIVVSDFQRGNWARADFALLPAGTRIQLEQVSPEGAPANVAVLRAEGIASSARDRTVRLEVEVGNFTPSSREVTAEVDVGGGTWRLRGRVPAAGRATLVEEIQLRTLGWQSGEARLADNDDALPADDARPLVVEIRPKPRYVMLTRQPATLRPSSSHYLQCALVPDRNPRDDAPARLARMDPAALDRQELTAADLILLDHPGKLADETLGLLAGLLRRGRAVIYVAAEPVDANNLKRLAEAAGGGLQMPVEFMPPAAGLPRRDLALARVRSGDRPFAVFGDELEAVVRPLRFAGGLTSRRLEGGLDDDVLATYGDGSACLVLGASDAGLLAVLNADLAASNLARTGAFVPLLDELIERMLARHRRDRALACGEPLVVHLPSEAGAAAELTIAGPGGAGAEPSGGRFGQLRDEGLGAVWHWPSPDEPGVYRIRRGDARVFALALAVPAVESHLECLPPEVLTERLSAGREVHYRNVSGEGDRRDDLWKWLAAACVLCMLGEVSALLAMKT